MLSPPLKCQDVVTKLMEVFLVRSLAAVAPGFLMPILVGWRFGSSRVGMSPHLMVVVECNFNLSSFILVVFPC